MRMKTILLMSVCLLSLPAQAEIYVQVNGTVTAASVPFGPWVEVQAGDSAYMVFAVPEQGDVLDPGHFEGYPILTKTFAMVINDIAVGLGESFPPPTAFISDDYPIADTFVMAPDAIRMSEPGYGLHFEVHDSTGTVWGSPTLAFIPGTYPADSFDDREWAVLVGDAGIDVAVTELIVYPVP
jgi:hypothetical protein